MTKSTSKTKSSKKFQKKKPQHSVHPYIECVQQEISSLQEELTLLETKAELTSEEETQLTITKACLERYQGTLSKLTEQTMSSKVQQLNSIMENEIRQKDETQLLSFLQVLFLMRLGQLGLYNFIEQAPSLQSISNLCDQIIGAAVYYVKDPSHQVREQKRNKIQDLLKKLEQGSNDFIEESDTTTFKQIKDFLQHIWDNTVDCTELVNNNNQLYSVIPFEGMVSSDPITDNTLTPLEPSPSSEDLVLEPVIESTTTTTTTTTTTSMIDPLDTSEKKVDTNECEPTKEINDNTPATTTTATKETNDNKPVTTTATTKETSDNKSTTTTTITKETGDNKPVTTTTSTKESSDNKPTATITTDTTSWDTKTSDNSQQISFESWEKESEPKCETQQESDNNGWNSIDNKAQVENWDSADRAWDTQNVINESTLSSPGVESPDTKHASDSDNWRNRDNNSGRGRGRGRGNVRGGRGRGRGSVRGGNSPRGRGIRGGRGRGRGREMDEDYNRNYSPQAQE